MMPGLYNWLRKNALLFLTIVFVFGVSGLIILLGLREGQSYHVSALNPTCDKSSSSSSVDCSCCHAVKMGMISPLLRDTINGKQIFGSSYYDANGYVYVLARARHDGAAPVITVGPSVINITYTTATVTWTTNENSTSWVDWGLTTGYGNTVGNGSYVTSHSVDLTGLTNHQTHHYRITTTDSLGNTLVTGDYTFTPNLPPPVPTVIDQPNWVAPSSPFTVTLSWNAVIDPDGGTVEYEVVIDDDPNFGSPNYTSAWVSGTSWAVDVASGYYYYWKVRARDAGAPTAISAWSSSDIFYVLSAAPPDAPTLISPPNGFYDWTANLSYNINFSWSAVTAPDGDPVEYLIEVSQASNFSVLYATSGWIGTNSWALSVGSGATYYWRVMARDAVHTDAQSVWSATFSFYIEYYGGSCPLVYVWTGDGRGTAVRGGTRSTGYVYQTDFQGGVIGLPATSPGGKYAGLYREGYINLGMLKPDSQGKYRIKLREAQGEADYVDQLKLLVVDHPRGTSVYDATAMNTYSYGYRTEPKLYTVKNARVPLQAWDKNGNNILSLVNRADNKTAPAGLNNLDYYIFDFGTIKDTANAKLLIDGWTAFGVKKSLLPGQTAVQPYIELVDGDGNWQKVKSIGIPAGDFKTVVVDLSGLFMSQDHRIKLCTGLINSSKVMIDQVRLDESAPVKVRTHLLTASAADLHHGGRPTYQAANVHSRGLAQDDALPDISESYYYGAFTRYGDVTELINRTDDEFVIMRHGDELTVTFPKVASPPLTYQRSFLLLADLYYKVRNLEIEPLPFHGMSSYLYPSTESYPQDAEHQAYLQNYNTRIYVKPAYLQRERVVALNSPAKEILLAWNYIKQLGREYLQKARQLMAEAGKGVERKLTLLASADSTPRHYSLNADYAVIKVYDKSMLNSVVYDINSSGSEAWQSNSWVTPAAPGTLATAEQKAAIAAIDASRWTTSLVSGDNTYNYQMYRFQITQVLNTLGQVSVTWRGYGEPTPGYNVDLYIWVSTGNSWEPLGSFYAPNDVQFTGSRRTFLDTAGRGAENVCTACHQVNYHQACMNCHTGGADHVAPVTICFWCHGHNSVQNFVPPTPSVGCVALCHGGGCEECHGMPHHDPGNCTHCHGSWFRWDLANDYTPPTITSGPTVVNNSATSVTITWTTNEKATSQINYGITNYGSLRSVSSTLSTTHTVTLTGLTPAATYHYVLKCTDEIWNVYRSGDFVFTTLTATPPTTPVLIDQPDAIYPGADYTVTLSWNPSTQAEGHPLEYYVMIDDASNFSSPNYTSGWISGTSWTVTVAAPADYYWRVQARDAVYPTVASDWSAPDSFFLMNASPPPAPTLIPQPDAAVYAYTYAITLQWNPVTAPDGDPVEYYAQLSWYADFSTIYASTPLWGAATDWALTVDTGYTYYWRVRSRDATHPTAMSNWSAPDDFYIQCTIPKSSCPFVYVWDGEKYQYTTDIQGEALGIPKTNPLYNNLTLYGPSYFVLNGLLPDGNNLYQVKLREVLAEADYFDEAKLLLADYPAGYEIVSSSAENTYYQGYVNPFKIYTLKDPRPPISATDQNGNDILDKVLAVDDNPAPPDIQAPEYYTFDFGPIAHPENAKLVLDGWSLYGPDAYKVVPNLPNIDPYVELINPQGQWQKVRTFGFISGDLKTMVVDLSGLFMSSDYRIRLNLGFYKPVRTIIDRVRLDDSAPVEVTVTELSALSADLHHGGNITASYSNLKHRIMALDDSQPDNETWYMYGAFTRYGEVSPLLAADDDKMVLMRHGDELSLAFPNIAPPAAGMERKALLKADVYYKSNKLSVMVEPLPYNVMTAYPPDPWLGPTSADYQQYLQEYNTRIYVQP